MIRDGCDAIINITTGAGLGMSMDQRLAAANHFRPEIASMNMGSFNFNISGAAKRGGFQHDWEQPYLEMTRDFILSNTFAQIDRAVTELSDHGTRFEFECYDMSHLYMLKHFVDRGAVSGPLYIQFVFGVLGGMAPDPDMLVLMKRTADRLFGDQYLFSVLAAGRQQIPMATMAASMGGHVRVGLEDSLWLGKGQLAKTNAEQVTRVRQILEGLGLTVATPDEAREILALKGGDQVGF